MTREISFKLRADRDQWRKGGREEERREGGTISKYLFWVPLKKSCLDWKEYLSPSPKVIARSMIPTESEEDRAVKTRERKRGRARWVDLAWSRVSDISTQRADILAFLYHQLSVNQMRGQERNFTLLSLSLSLSH
jgi:hypothetical protein